MLILFCGLLFLSAGCIGEIQAQRQAMVSRLYETIPTCENEQDCKEKWNAAQAWIATNCGMKIQIATDTIIETYNPTGGSTRLAARAIKEPLGDGKYRIVINVWCDNFLGCFPDALESAVDFNQYVGRFGSVLI